MSSLRVNTITNTTGTGPVEFTKGVSVPSDQVIITPNVNLTGIVTASSFIGNGSEITGFIENEVTISKSIAFSLIT
jgi:hypothetical protein